ncbi:MAG: ERF family protein [Alphaproteobacteria bacterium]
MLRVIERAAADPDVPIERLDRLATLYERMVSREAETKFNAALVKMQPKLPVLEERGQITGPDGAVRATYATWEDTVEAIRPMLARHGFSLSFKPGRSPRGVPTVTGVLRHEAGHKEEAEIELPADTSGDKNPVQAVGSTMSYGQRYVAKMLLNLTSRGEDDDGHAAGQSGAEFGAIAEINALADKPAFLAWKRSNRKLLGELSPPEFQRVIGHYSTRLIRIEGEAQEEGAS